LPSHTAATFRRWTRLALARALVGAPPCPALSERHWRRAQRLIAARFALACAREGLLKATLQDLSWILDDGAAGLRIPLARLGAFGLHSPDLEGPCSPQAEDPSTLLDALAPALGATKDTVEGLRAELVDSAFNLAMSSLLAELRDQAAAAGHSWPAPVDPENLVVDGHPWHPMCKSRIGLRHAEVLRHAPEGLALGTIDAVDVTRDLVQLAGDAEATLARLFPLGPPGTIRLPVHRAQLRRLPRLFPDLWGAKIRPTQLRPLEGRALLSLRTIAVERPELHLKLALNVTTTSARRTVSPMSVANGPPLTRLFEQISAADPAIAGLFLLGDRAAAGLRAEVVGPRAPHLGAIVRDSPEALLRGATGSSAEAWVCAALGERRPAAKRTLLVELAERQGSAEALLRRYIELLVPPCLHLLSVYGLVLEVHLQNTLAAVDDDGLVGFVVRDLGGIRLHPGRLRSAGHSLSLAPGSFLATDDLAEVRDKLSHTLLHAHLAALFRWAERDLGLPARRSWSLVRATIMRAAERVPAGRRDAALADRDALLRPRTRAKALLRMRFEDRISDYAYTEVDNILAHPEVVALATRELAR